MIASSDGVANHPSGKHSTQKAENISEPDLDTSVKDAAFGVGIELGKAGVLVRWKDDLTISALAFVEDVFGVDEQAVLAECFFAKQANLCGLSRKRTIVEGLSASVIEFNAALKICGLLEKIALLLFSRDLSVAASHQAFTVGLKNQEMVVI